MKTNTKIMIAGKPLAAIMMAVRETEEQMGFTAPQMASSSVAAGNTEYAAEFTLYEAVNVCCYCEDCKAWHVTHENLARVIQYITRLQSNITKDLVRIPISDKQHGNITEWLAKLSIIQSDLATYIETAPDANSSTVH